MLKTTFMNRLLPLVVLIGFSTAARAQAGFTLTTPPCHNNGILTVSFPGTLTPPLTVNWTTAGTSGMTITHTGVSGLGDVLTGYSGGAVSVYATDALGMSDGGFYGGAPPFTVSVTKVNATCPSPDTATAVAAGGTAPYTYTWYNESTFAVVGTGSTNVLPTGLYGVTVTDAHGCVYGSMDDDIVDTLLSAPTFTASVTTTTAACTDGTATAVTSGGGIAPFTYLWTNGANTATIGGLVTGTYGVTVTDAAGCSSGLVYGTVPQSVTISIPYAATPATCSANDGVVVVSAIGGTAPYTYVWSNGSTAVTQTGLPVGQYDVQATDANGCIGSTSFYLASTSLIGLTYSTTPSLCLTATGTATLIVSGASLPYSVEWFTTPAQTGLTASNLAPGDYAFRVTDGGGCEAAGTVTVNQIDAVNATFTATNAYCASSNGSLTVIPTGGVAPYSYSWSTGATTAGISSVPAGTYTVTVRDNLGCKETFVRDVPANSPVGVGLYPMPASCVLASDGTISAVAWGGTPPYSYGWTGGGSGSTLGSLPPGFYTVRVTDATGCTAYNSINLGYNTAASNCYCTISGIVFNDTNGNCVQDAGEPGLSRVQVYCSGIGYTYTDNNGNYSFRVPAGSYTITETLPSYAALPGCQANGIPVATAVGSGCQHTINFANSVATVHDLHVSTWDYIRAAQGQEYTQVIVATNDGTVTEDTVAIRYHTDGQEFTPIMTPSGIFTGASNIYDADNGRVDSMIPGASQAFYMNYPVPGNIPSSTSVVFTDTIGYNNSIANWLTDNTPVNNVNTLKSVVGSSLSPNFKEVYPQGTGPTGVIAYTDSVLEYMIHFENSAAVPVQNVVILDTLDDNLQWASLKPEYMSAPCKILLTQVGAKKVASFTFTGINLAPYVQGDLACDGMLTYTIKINEGLPLGSTFRNHASVYFDFNSPVMTNATLNTLGSVPSSVVNTSLPGGNQSFRIYPNPAATTFSAVISADNATTATLSVIDVAGKLLVSKTVDLQKGVQTIATDVSAFTSGVYFVTLNANGAVQTQKLVIIK